jgi:decaprenylphospho-beta-D-ribofuranose 2-oxidase
MNIRVRQGWGLNFRSRSTHYSIREFHGQRLIQEKSGLPVGNARSYGDTSLNSDGAIFSTSDSKAIVIDVENQVANCESGVTIGELERAAIEYGFFPETVPGTEYVTIGGAIASNIHGKSHHAVGAFSSLVAEINLKNAYGEVITVSPKGEYQDLYWATLGGLGLTGMILGAKIRLRKIENSFLRVSEFRVSNIDKMLEKIKKLDKEYLYTVAWIDLSGKFKGRGVVSVANHANSMELKNSQKKYLFWNPRFRKIRIPEIFPNSTINSVSVRIFNQFWFRKPLNNSVSHFRKFFHPLDGITNWNRVYGKRGFIQAQFLIPFENEYFLKEVLQTLRRHRIVSFLGVLKKMGEADLSYIGFCSPGWTLAIDFVNDQRKVKVMIDLTQRLADIGGRVYLTKDSFLDQQTFEKMYPNHNKWKLIKKKYDPDNFWQSDQGRRIGLC